MPCLYLEGGTSQTLLLCHVETPRVTQGNQADQLFSIEKRIENELE